MVTPVLCKCTQCTLETHLFYKYLTFKPYYSTKAYSKMASNQKKSFVFLGLLIVIQAIFFPIKGFISNFSTLMDTLLQGRVVFVQDLNCHFKNKTGLFSTSFVLTQRYLIANMRDCFRVVCISVHISSFQNNFVLYYFPLQIALDKYRVSSKQLIQFIQ